jgi:hypothetical protein
METMKKRMLSVFALLLVCVILWRIPPVFGKYVSDANSGTLWESMFTGSSIDFSNIFYITEPGYSDNLHGFDVKDENGNIQNPTTVQWTDQNGNIIKADEYYDLTKEVNVSFPVYNGSSNNMLICFNVGMCMNRSLSGTSSITLVLTGQKNDAQNNTLITDSVSGSFSLSAWDGSVQNPSAGLNVERSADVQYEGAGVTIFGIELASSDYYLYQAYLNTYEAKNGTDLDCFILKPGESATFSISVAGANEYTNLDKIYSSIYLVSVECDESGNPIN